MEWWLIISLLFGGMVFLLLTNLPIAFAFLVVNMVAAYFFLGGIPGLIGVVTGSFHLHYDLHAAPCTLFHPDG